MSKLPCIICNVLQEVPDAEGLMAVKCDTCGKTQSEATIRERERIIENLREKLNDPEAPMLGTQGGWLNYLVALIKGENK